MKKAYTSLSSWAKYMKIKIKKKKTKVEKDLVVYPATTSNKKYRVLNN